MNTESRDRAFERIITVNLRDATILEAIFKNIPRENLIKNTWLKNGQAVYAAKLNKSDILVIKLSIKDVRVARVPKHKKACK